MTRLRKSLLTVGLLVGLALGVTVLWREVVVETAARLALSAGAFEEARFEVVEVGWREIVVEDVALGPGLPTARRVRLGYAPGDLASGRVREVRVEGLRAALPSDWRAARARLVELAPAGVEGNGRGDGEGWVAVSRVALEDAAITFADPAEGVIRVNGALDLSGERPGAALEVALALGPTEGTFTVRSSALRTGGVVEIDGGGTTELAGLAGPRRAAAHVTGGRAAFTLAGAVPIPSEAALSPGAWADAALALEGGLRVSGATLADYPGTLSGEIAWALRGAGSGLRLALTRPARLHVAGIGPAALAALGLAAEAPRDLSLELSAGGPLVTWSRRADGGEAELEGTLDLALGDATGAVRATATLVHDAAWRLSEPAGVTLRASAKGWDVAGPGATARLRQAAWDAAGSVGRDGALALRGPASAEMDALRAGGLAADTAAFDGDLRLEASSGSWSARLEPGATLALEGAAVPGQVRVGERATLTFDRLEASGGRGAAQLALAAASGPLAGVLFEGDGGGIPFAETEGRAELDLTLGGAVTGEARLAEAQATLPGQGLSVEDASARLPFGPDGIGGTVRLSAGLRETGRGRRFAPLRVALEGEPGEAGIAVSGSVATSNGAVRVPVSGSVDPAEASVRMTGGPTRVTFRPGGLQPDALSGALAAVRDVAGAVTIGGDVAADAGGAVRTRLRLAFDDLSARSEALQVAGLTGELALTGLAPLATAGPQSLSARRVIAGVPVEAPRLRFTIPPRAGGPLVRIHEATAELAGGEVAVRDAQWDAGAAQNAVEVAVRSVSLGRLLSEWQIEGISGTGRLSGTIPVRVGPEGVVIEGGRLAAGGAGRISVDWGAARETLVQSGEQVALTVRALEDFRYDSLTIGVDRPADGTLTLDIGLEGANPEVLDGHPFRFNIALSGRLEPILAAVREGRRIGAELIRGGIGR